MRHSRKIWTQKNGSKIEVGKMGNTHLLSTIAMLERLARHAHDREMDACASISFTGEIAQMQQDRFLEQSEWDDYLPDIYDDLKEEARGRRLKLK